MLLKILRISLPAALLIAQSCAIAPKPCTSHGDFKWPNKIKGTMRCHQKETTPGVYVNDGAFVQLQSSGKGVALKGEFADGRMNGLWTEYNPKGEPLLEKYFVNGVERPIPASAEVPILPPFVPKK